jgi:hypothetical protein
MSFGMKIAMTTVMSCIALATLLNAISIYQAVYSGKESIAELRRTLLADYDELIKSEVETNVSMIGSINEQAQKAGQLKNIVEQFRV